MLNGKSDGKAQELQYLTNNLINLLKHLKFTDIKVKSISEYPNPEGFHFEGESSSYIPALAAKKNEVVYYFELVERNSFDLIPVKNPLYNLQELADAEWAADFVLVTRYGNKDNVKEWCHEHNLNILNIWEL